MKQSKIESLIETLLDVGSGFFLSVVIWAFVIAPYLGIEHNIVDNVLITTVFTTSSVARKFFWRRYFNAGVHKKVHDWLKRD